MLMFLMCLRLSVSDAHAGKSAVDPQHEALASDAGG